MSSKRRERSITDLCGGRRAAIVPAQDARACGISHGALRLYTDFCGHAKPNGELWISLKKYAQAVGISVRTAQRHKKELEELGWLEQLSEGDKAIGHYRVIRDSKERPDVLRANIPKLKARKIEKTPHATQTSHPRCDAIVAQNMSREHDPLLSPNEAKPSRSEKSSASEFTKELVNGKGPSNSVKADQQIGKGRRRSQPDKDERSSAYWPKWLERTYPLDNGWKWFIETSEEIRVALGIPGPAADDVLRQCLFQARSTNASLSKLSALVQAAIKEARTQSDRQST